MNFNFQIKNLKGEEITGDQNSASEILSTFLASSNKGNSLKLWDWAQKIYKKEELNLDKTDLEVLQALVENTENLPVITKAQILEVIKKEIHK